jgi:hypothetical protein
MNFLAGRRALIFDLRGNGGGSPDMVQFILPISRQCLSRRTD